MYLRTHVRARAVSFQRTLARGPRNGRHSIAGWMADGREGWQAGIPYGGGDGDGPTRPQGWASVCHAVLYRRSPCRCADATAAATTTAVDRQHSIEYNVCVVRRVFASSRAVYAFSLAGFYRLLLIFSNVLHLKSVYYFIRDFRFEPMTRGFLLSPLINLFY